MTVLKNLMYAMQQKLEAIFLLKKLAGNILLFVGILGMAYILLENTLVDFYNLKTLQYYSRAIDPFTIVLASLFFFAEKFEEYVTDLEKMHELEEELLVAQEVSIRLHSELEQAEEWRVNAEKLNKDLKTKLDELKEFIDSDVNNFQKKI